MRRIYWETVKKWAIKAGVPVGVVGFALLFYYLVMIGGITIIGYSGDEICVGTIEDPCYAYINFTANEDIFIYPVGYDPWGRDTPFSTDEGLESWKMYRSWGTSWREIKLNETCTGTWCGAPDNRGVAYSFVFRKGRNYQIRIEAIKQNPGEDIKWGFGPVDPVWKGINKENIFPRLISNKAELTRGEAVFEIINPFKKPINAEYFNFDFIEAKGKLDGFEYFINYSENYQEPVYGQVTEVKSCTRINNQTNLNETYDCSETTSYISGYENKARESWKKLDLIPPGSHKIKLIGRWKAQIGKRAIEWVPNLRFDKKEFSLPNDIILTRSEWAWWNVSWTAKKQIDITENSGISYTNYSVLFNITYDSDMNASFKDLRFTNSTEDTELGYWIEEKSDENWASVWVRVLTLTASSNTTIYMYYDNPTIGSNSDIKTAFVIGDDFDDDSVDTTLWTQTGTVVESGGVITITSQEGDNLVAKVTFDDNISVRRYANATGAWGNAIGWGSTGRWYSAGANYIAAMYDSAAPTGWTFYNGARVNSKSSAANIWYKMENIMYDGNWSMMDCDNGWYNCVYEPASISYTWSTGKVGIMSRGLTDYIMISPKASVEPTYYIGDEESVDTAPPTYSNNGVNNTGSAQLAKFYILYNDDTALHPTGQYIFSTNNTGIWTNESAVNFTATPSWANVTKTLNSTIGLLVGYRWYAFDNATNYNNTEIFTMTLTDAINPVASFGTNPVNAYNSSSPNITFDLKCTDETGVSTLVLYGNWTGTWQANQTNSSPVNDTYWNITVSGIPEGKSHIWGVWCNDSSNNEDWTDTNRSFLVDTTSPTSSFGTNPVDTYNSTSSSVTFDFKASDNFDVDTIQLFGNWSGSWTANYTNTSYTNDTWLNITVSGISDGTYKWGIFSNDSTTNSDWTDNRTFTVDTSLQDLIITSGTTSLGGDLEYGWVYVAAGATLQVDGTKYLNITAIENITIHGTLNGAGLGCAGGVGVHASSGTAGSCSGPGAGGTFGSAGTQSGGGGAGHKSAGGLGGSGTGDNKAAGGTAYGNHTNFTIYTGSGGGGGGAFDNTEGGNGGAGGAGISLKAPLIFLNGTASVNGNNGVNAKSDAYVKSGGGAGSAGTFQFIGRTINISGATINAVGGTGGNDDPSSATGSGGGGSGGVIKIFYQVDLYNTSLTTNVAGGNPGSGSYQGTAGGSGIVYLSQEYLGFFHTNLISPENDSSLASQTNFFIANITDQGSLGIQNFSLLIDGIINQTNTSGIEGIYNWTLNLNDGDYNWTAIAYDDNNDSYDTSTWVFTIDTIKPAVLYNPTTESDNSYLNRNYSLVNISASDTNLDSVRLNWNGTNETFASNEGDDYWENKTNLAEGVYTFYGWANDTAGWYNLTTERTIKIDTITPLIEFEDPTPENYTVTTSVNYIFVNVSVTELNPINITYYLYNSTSLVNETTYLMDTQASNTTINFTDLGEESYFFNVTIVDIVSHSNSTETREYHYTSAIRIFFNEVEGNNTAELGTLELLANTTALSLPLYVDIIHPAFGENYSSGTGSANFNFSVDYFRDTLFSDDAESKTFNYTTLDINNLTFDAHQYDEIDAMTINISGANDPFDVLIFQANSTPDITNQTQFEPLIDRFFDGQLVGDNIYVSQFWDNTYQTNLTFNTGGELFVYFLLDDIMRTTSTYSFLLNVTGWLFGYDFTDGDITTRFANYNNIDTAQTTAQLDFSGAMMAKNSSQSFSNYDSYDSSINGTLWGEYIANPITSENTETGSYIQSTVAYPTGDASFTDHSAYVWANYSWFNLYSSNKLTFRVVTDYNAFESEGDAVDGRSKIYLGNTIIWTSSNLDNSEDSGSEAADGDLDFILTKHNNTKWLVEISGIETSYQLDYGGCNEYPASGIWNWTDGTWDIWCINPEYGGPWSGSLDNSFYATVDYESGITLASMSIASKQYRGDLFNIHTRLYAVNRDLYNRENGTIISQSIYDSSADIDKATIWTGGNTGSAGETLAGYLSADNGVNWESVTEGVEHSFVNTGRNLRFKLVINVGAGGYFTSPLRIFKVNVSVPSDSPSEVSFDFGDDGTIDYTISGKINSTNGSIEVDLSNISLSSAFVNTNKFTNFGITHDHVYKIPLLISTDTRGVLQVDAINLTYDPNPVSLNTEYISDVLDHINTTNFTTFRIPIGAFNLTADPVNITVNDIRKDYAGGNYTVQFLVHDANYVLNKTANLIYYYSSFYKNLPYTWMDYILFLPRTNSSKNVSAYGQTSTIPLFNITTTNYGGKDLNFSISVEQTYSCLNLTWNATGGTKPTNQIISASWQEIASDLGYLSNQQVWFWADLEDCNASDTRILSPSLNLSAYCVGCLWEGS